MSEGEPRLHVDADLVVELDGSPMTVRGAGEEIVVDVPDLRTALAAARSVREAAGPLGRSAGVLRGVADIGDHLRDHGLRARVDVGGRTLVRFGGPRRDRRPAVLAAAAVAALGVLLAVLRRRRR